MRSATFRESVVIFRHCENAKLRHGDFVFIDLCITLCVFDHANLLAIILSVLLMSHTQFFRGVNNYLNNKIDIRMNVSQINVIRICTSEETRIIYQ